MNLKHNKYIFIIIAFLIAFAIYLQYTITQSTEKLKDIEIHKSLEYAEKISDYLHAETTGDLETFLTQHLDKQESLNKVLHTFISKDFKYIFLIKKDEKGHYRFLLDGSLYDPVVYRSIFFPKSEVFDEVYNIQKPQIIEQTEGVEEIWLSLLYPMVANNKTEALLVIDLSESYGVNIASINRPMRDILFWMQIFLFISAVFLFFTIYNYSVLRKSLLEDSLTKVKTKIYLREFFDNKNVDKFNAILLDIDKFRIVNEKYGFDAGDKILILFVGVLKKQLPKDAIIIRVGGAEFFIALPKISGDLVILSRSLFKKLSDKRYLIQNNTIVLTLSMAVLETPEETKSLMDVERILDHKLLEIKSSGKNRCVMISSNVKDEIKYRNIDYIAKVLEAEQLVCVYQPIQDVENGKFIKYEALVRLVDVDENILISPHYFLNIIRNTFKYIKMSRLVFDEAFKVLYAYPDIEVSLNLDLYDLYNDELIDLITMKLYDNKDVANRLTFEILEDHEIKDFARVSLIFQKLKTYGSKIAIDDFGSGHSSYIYLMKLDIDILKIDGSLIHALKEEPERAKIVLASICTLAKEQNYEVVAEFVSDEELYDAVKELGIRYVQGYHIGKPKPIEEYLIK